MQALKRDWGTMHIDHRKGGGPQLVFVNSLGADLRMWDATVESLPADWACLRMDKRGHGLSDRSSSDYGVPDLADDVLAAMNNAGMDGAYIIGCSVGGLIAQHVALAAPNRVIGLVLSNTAPILGAADLWRNRIDEIRSSGMAAMTDAILQRWFGPAMLARPESQLWRTLLARADPEGYIATCAAIADADITDQLGGILQPVRVIGGRHDLATPPAVVRALTDALPRADLVMFEAAGHLPAIEEPKAFSDSLMDFIERTRE